MAEDLDGPWECRRCAHINPPTASYCINCSAARGPRIRGIWIAAALAVAVVASMMIFALYVFR